MFDIDNWQEIWHTIMRNKFRSILTGFGIFWGILMLILLLGLGYSLEGGVLKIVDGFSANTCFFFTDRTSVPYKGYRKGRSWDMKNRDLTLIREKSKAVEYISPMIFGNQGSKNIARGQKSGSFGTRGVYSEHFSIEQQHILAGRLFNPIDIEQNRKVCIIGKNVSETLFNKGENPIGEYIRVNGIYFQIVGVIRPKSNISIGGNVEETVFLPFSTMQRAFNQGDIIHFMACTAKPGYPAAMVEDEVIAVLKNAHDIAPDDDKAIRSINIEKQFQMFQMLFIGVGFLIWLVGGMALLSGVIGISNIMLVTVRERTREIGVRRALGAKPAQIVMQILSESFVLTALAGLSSFMLGVGILEIVRQSMESATEDMFFIPPLISFSKAMIALTVLVFAGVLSGLMPAMRALKIKAIDAIREE
ncbi:MAG: ABC transporter permease [Prevotella sp.]|jgi:putative ABC transport system permease protein|nr:ABC transporter permease [Prevotella sp.]